MTDHPGDRAVLPARMLSSAQIAWRAELREEMTVLTADRHRP